MENSRLIEVVWVQLRKHNWIASNQIPVLFRPVPRSPIDVSCVSPEEGARV